MHKLTRIIALASFTLSMTAHGHAAPPPPGGNPSQLSSPSAESEDSLILARLLNPIEPMVELAGRSFDQAFGKGMAMEGGSEEIEKALPGFVEALRTAIRDATLADLRADMPAIHRRYAEFFAEQFTPEETAELIDFYSSPTGRKIIQTKFANIDVSGVVDRLAADADTEISSEDLKQINESAMPAVWQGMMADDVRTVLTFGLRPVARKLQGAAPALAAIEAEIANEPDPELDAAIEAATQQVYEQFGLNDAAED